MKLESVTIWNFRGFSELQEIAIGDLTTIVGKNDVGKSTVLEALAIFFGSDVIKPDVGDVNAASELREFEVTCTFSNLPHEVILDAQATTALSSEYLLTEDGRLRIKKKWDCTGSKPKEEVFVVCNHPATEGLSNLLLLNINGLRARLQQFLPPDVVAAANKASNPAMRRVLWESVASLPLETQEIPVAKEDSKRIWERLAPMLPHFALFQSDRASRDTDNEVQDPMKLAITAALAESGVQTALAGVVEAVRNKATELAVRTHTALGELDPDLAEGLVPTFKSDPRWSSLFSVALEGSDGIPINKRGSGVRRLVLVSFFRAEAQRQMEDGSERSVIYAIEEPETSQHPRNQKILLESFQQMAATAGCQVLLTTHSPSLAGHLPADSLRFVSKMKGTAPQIIPASASTWSAIAEDLGILPDDRVRVLVCVEGPGDVLALRALSNALNLGGDAVINLSSDQRVAFVPLGGGTLTQWVAERYLKGFGRPEFHIYDNDVAKYQRAASAVNARTDGSAARLTDRREMENYLHPDAIKEALDVVVTFDPTDNVPELIANEIRKNPDRRQLNVSTVKRKLASDAFPKMTKELIDLSDPAGEVKSWLAAIEAIASR